MSLTLVVSSKFYVEMVQFFCILRIYAFLCFYAENDSCIKYAGTIALVSLNYIKQLGLKDVLL